MHKTKRDTHSVGASDGSYLGCVARWRRQECGRHLELHVLVVVKHALEAVERRAPRLKRALRVVRYLQEDDGGVTFGYRDKHGLPRVGSAHSVRDRQKDWLHNHRRQCRGQAHVAKKVEQPARLHCNLCLRHALRGARR